jgi:hypothetical protein
MWLKFGDNWFWFGRKSGDFWVEAISQALFLLIRGQSASYSRIVQESSSFLYACCCSVSIPADSPAPSGGQSGTLFQTENKTSFLSLFSLHWTADSSPLTLELSGVHFSPAYRICFSEFSFCFLNYGQSGVLQQTVQGTNTIVYRIIQWNQPQDHHIFQCWYFSFILVGFCLISCQIFMLCSFLVCIEQATNRKPKEGEWEQKKVSNEWRNFGLYPNFRQKQLSSSNYKTITRLFNLS